jgi:hypothetical protein
MKYPLTNFKPSENEYVGMALLILDSIGPLKDKI